MTRRTWLFAALSAALLLVVGRTVAGAYVEYRWFAALGEGPLAVWRARATNLLALRGFATAFAGAFAFANLYGVRASVASLILPKRLGDLEIGEQVSGRRLVVVAAMVSALLGLTLGPLLDEWAALELVRNGEPFAVPEPYTGRELGFFVYWLPLEHALYTWALVVLVVIAAIVIALYALTAGLRWERGRVRMTTHVRRHLALLATALVLALAWGHRLDAYGLLSAGSGGDGAFTYADRVVGLPARFALAALTALASLVVLRAAWLGQTRVTFWAVSAVLVAALVLREVVPALATQSAGRVRTSSGELPQGSNRSAFTQMAYGTVALRRAASDYGVANYSQLASAVSVWDPAALTGVRERADSAEAAIDVGWTSVAGAVTAVLVARAQTPGQPPAPSRAAEAGWDVTLVAASTSAPNGDAVRLDPASIARDGPGGAPATRAVVYPGASAYAIVDDSAGVVRGDPVRAVGARLAHAWDQRDLRLLSRDGYASAARPELVDRRDVRERLRAVVPFFAQAQSVAPAVAADTLYWLVHLYAVAPHFPLSQHFVVATAERAYFRHAGTAAVNSLTGHVTLVPAADLDPIASTWVRRFPTLFTSPARLAPALAGALSPDTDGVMVQAAVLARHGTRAELGAGVVTFPGGSAADSLLGVSTRAHSLLPPARPAGGNQGAVPAWTLPMLDPASRLAGLLVSIGGAAPETIWLPAPAAEPRWREVVERLRSAADSTPTAVIAGERAGATVARGRVRVLPVAGRLAYVQPTFIRDGDGPARLAVVSAIVDGQGRGAADLATALGVARPVRPGQAEPTSPEGVRQRARALYASMREALARGDWAAFGAAFDSLGTLIGGR